ncbi:MAG: electron transport complex subunit RsxC [Phycisphaerales bacterium]|nr:electron transport complex subunit RsxC [Phycisphaerales bacterium]
MTPLPLQRSFRHGVHPAEHKEATEHLPLERMPFVDRYVLPLGQHIGAPCRAVVRAGDRVRRGQLIAEPGGFVSIGLHSPVSGRVLDVGPHRHPNGQLVAAIRIEADPYSSQQITPGPTADPASLGLDEFLSHVQLAGLVGLGGAAFPSHVKYKLPEGKACERLLINGCECEPYLTCDHRVMVERPEAVVRGVELLAERLGAASSWIGVEMNKPDGFDALSRCVPAGATINISPLSVKYPQGAEKMLIEALFGEEVPAGKLPIDLGIVVNNVATMASLADSFDRGIPLIERALTVAGPGVDRPANLIVPIGTPIRDVLAHCGINQATRQVVMGGPMMGMPLATLDAPVLKGTSGLLAFTEDIVNHPTEYACVRARAGRYEDLEKSYVMDCMECGACTYTCPSGVPIVHLIRAAKLTIRQKKANKA